MRSINGRRCFEQSGSALRMHGPTSMVSYHATLLLAFSDGCLPCDTVLYGPERREHYLLPCTSPRSHAIVRALCRPQGSMLALTWVLTVATGVLPEYALSDVKEVGRRNPLAVAFGRVTKVSGSSSPSLWLSPPILASLVPPLKRYDSPHRYFGVLDRGLNLSCWSTDELIDRVRDQDRRGRTGSDQGSRKGVEDKSASRFDVLRFIETFIIRLFLYVKENYDAQLAFQFLDNVNKLWNSGDDFGEENLEAHHVEGAFVDSILYNSMLFLNCAH
ncbi:hypothetical protein GW17_00019415 [Ensete ventricosum]|nr:hypothetical protein GW17_00019415 [Ensete ventricosum]